MPVETPIDYVESLILSRLEKNNKIPNDIAMLAILFIFAGDYSLINDKRGKNCLLA